MIRQAFELIAGTIALAIWVAGCAAFVLIIGR